MRNGMPAAKKNSWCHAWLCASHCNHLPFFSLRGADVSRPSNICLRRPFRSMSLFTDVLHVTRIPRDSPTFISRRAEGSVTSSGSIFAIICRRSTLLASLRLHFVVAVLSLEDRGHRPPSCTPNGMLAGRPPFKTAPPNRVQIHSSAGPSITTTMDSANVGLAFDEQVSRSSNRTTASVVVKYIQTILEDASFHPNTYPIRQICLASR